ncbi:MAG TPA: A/G-specific adenine glycosylase [Candidatus Angelobacter sp.]
MRTAPSLLGKADVTRFRKLLLRWYNREKRTLPWRGESDPYRILVSEIMLQQTRVAVVMERYKTFLHQFPTVNRLAGAREQTVLAAWSGLGYYRRARSLHAAAKVIRRHGAFPASAAALQELPGVGRYTANAVASIAFGEPAPVVDGNVKRVLRRLLAHTLSDDQCWQAAGELLDKRRPGDFNQAMMELGAVACLPGEPLCLRCPVAALCASRGAEPRRQQAARRKSVLHYALACRNGRVLLRQRERSDSLMPGMWELPLLRAAPAKRAPILKLRHSITTTDYSVSVFAGHRRAPPQGRWVRLRTAQSLALTGLARKILQRLDAV